MLNQPLPERVMKYEVTRNGIKFNKKITLPYEPFIGTLGCQPADRGGLIAPARLLGRQHGPARCRRPAPSSISRSITGGLSLLGDCHGTQGDGEFCGVAVEMPSTTTVRVDLIKNWTIAWPRLENERFIMTIGSARPMEDAARIAYRELVRWLASDYGFDELEAYFLLTQAGRCGSATWSIPNTRSAPRSSNPTSPESERELRNMDLGLKGLNVIITGGSKGIGRHAADIFADEGANVSICARKAADVNDAVASLEARKA